MRAVSALSLAILLAVAWTACGGDGGSGSKKSSTSERDDSDRDRDSDDDRDGRDADDDTSADDPEIDYNDDEEPDPSGFPQSGTCDDWDDWECTDEGEPGSPSGGCHATCRDDDGVLHRFTMPAYEDIIPACWHGDDLDTCSYEHWTDDPCDSSGTCGRAFRKGCCNYGVE